MPGRAAVRAVVASVCVLAGLTCGDVTTASASGACAGGLVALTFDDGPAAAVTGKLLDVLSERHVPATFFVLGGRVAATPRLARTAYRRGFVVGNHTYRHELLTRLSDDAVRRTLRATDRALREAGVRPAPLMRPPYGALDSGVRAVVSGLGLTPVLWDIDPRDWESGSPATISSRVLGALRPEGRNIVLLHDGVARSTNTLRAVPAIVRGARGRGYCFAELDPSGRPVLPVRGASVSDADVTEGEPGGTVGLRFTIRLERPTVRPTSVRVRTVDGTARVGDDYRAVDRRVDVPAGATRVRVTVQVRGDRVDETTESLRLRLSEPTGLRLRDAVGVGSIRDDDPPPRVTLTDTAVPEPATGSATGTVEVRLDRSSSREVVLVLATVPGEADESDFVSFEVTRTLAPGELRAEVPVEVLADAVDEDVETFEVRVVSVTRATVARGTATVAITPPVAGSPG